MYVANHQSFLVSSHRHSACYFIIAFFIIVVFGSLIIAVTGVGGPTFPPSWSRSRAARKGSSATAHFRKDMPLLTILVVSLHCVVSWSSVSSWIASPLRGPSIVKSPALFFCNLRQSHFPKRCLYRIFQRFQGIRQSSIQIKYTSLHNDCLPSLPIS